MISELFLLLLDLDIFGHVSYNPGRGEVGVPLKHVNVKAKYKILCEICFTGSE